MIPVVLTVLLYLAFLLVLASYGFLSGLAPMDWLLLTGTALLATLSGVLLYRGALRAWVRGRNHPASLRLLASVTATFFWLDVFVALFWAPATRSLPWGGDGTLGALTVAVVVAAAGLLLAAQYAGRRRIGGA